MTEKMDMLFTFYAANYEQAAQKAEEVLKKYAYERFDLKAYPDGFRMALTSLPGKIVYCVDNHEEECTEV